MQLQSNRYNVRPILVRTDMMDIFSRIVTFNSVPMSIEVGVMADLPNSIKHHIGDHETFKVEWMKNGTYLISMSDSYAENVIQETMLAEMARKANVPPKLVDYCGLSEFDMPYKMWIESLFYPSSAISLTGAGFWKTDNKVAWTTVRVMSVIVRHDYIITATTVGRGVTYTF